MAVDAALRGGAIALLLLLTVLALRQARSSAAAGYSAAFSLSVAAYAIESTPAAAIQHTIWIIPLRLASIGTPAIFWLWASANFDDDFVSDRRRWLAWFGLVGLGAAAIAIDRTVVWRLLQAATLVLAGMGLWRILAGERGDLVEVRRRFRFVLAVTSALYIIALNLPHLLPGRFGLYWPGSLMNAAGLAAMTFLYALMSLTPDESPAAPPSLVGAEPVPARAVATAPVADEQERAWLAALNRAMDDDKAYREEGFGIAALAARLEIPEYRLRRLINQRLGHRNFTAFVNSYRLAETMAALADPDQAAVPILTIALDAGFQSLGPFNRAFKAQFGVTPSAFRQSAGRQPQSATG